MFTCSSSISCHHQGLSYFEVDLGEIAWEEQKMASSAICIRIVVGNLFVVVTSFLMTITTPTTSEQDEGNEPVGTK